MACSAHSDAGGRAMEQRDGAPSEHTPKAGHRFVMGSEDVSQEKAMG